MNLKHLDLERIVAVSDDPALANEAEKLHLKSCPKCRRRLEIAARLEEAIAESVAKTPPAVDKAAIDVLADRIFDAVSEKRGKNLSILKFAASAALLFSLFFVFFFYGHEKKLKSGAFGAETLTVAAEEGPSKFSGQPSSQVVEKIDDFSRSSLKAAKGSKFSGTNYSLTVKKESRLIREDENYFILKSGIVEFSVRSGTDFMVNLNDKALARALGTLFTVAAEKNFVSVSVSDGSVEFIDLEKGKTEIVAKGREAFIYKKAKIASVSPSQNEKKAVKTPKTAKIVPDSRLSALAKSPGSAPAASDSPLLSEKSKPEIDLLKIDDREILLALIKDFENSLETSRDPLADLRRLFALYKKTERWGSIVYYWKRKEETIVSNDNPFLYDMYFAACEASIKLFLYDNEICKDFKRLFPNSPEPPNLKEYLDLAL